MSTAAFKSLYAVLGMAGLLILLLCSCLVLGSLTWLYSARTGAQAPCPNKFDMAGFKNAVQDHILVELKPNNKMTLHLASDTTFAQDINAEVRGDSFCVENNDLWNIFTLLHTAGYGDGDLAARKELGKK